MMAQSALKSCDICMSGPGRNYCEQCDQWMCENCKTLHLRSKICRNHSFLSGSKIIMEESPLCKEHNKNFIFYCIDCDIPICKMCIGKKHKKHITSEINESTEQLQAEVKKDIDSKISFVKKNLDKIEQVKGKYQSDIKEAIRVIIEEGTRMKQWIDKKVQALITSLEEKATESLQALQPIITGFQNDFEKFKKCQTAFMESQKIVDVFKLLTHLKHIKSEVHIDVAGEKQPLVMPTITYNKKDVSEREIINLFGDVSFKEQSTKTVYIYQCSKCWENISSQSKPRRLIDGYGNNFYCGNCGDGVRFKYIKKE